MNYFRVAALTQEKTTNVHILRTNFLQKMRILEYKVT